MERSPAEQLIIGQGNLLTELHELGADVNWRAIEELMAQERQKMFDDLKAKRDLGSTATKNFQDFRREVAWQSGEMVED